VSSLPPEITGVVVGAVAVAGALIVAKLLDWADRLGRQCLRDRSVRPVERSEYAP
jgi:hypothetical protein